ncbi:MAG: hypothetical protein ACRDJE_12005, partial [Dehalococcoidia bacterium]
WAPRAVIDAVLSRIHRFWSDHRWLSAHRGQLVCLDLIDGRTVGGTLLDHGLSSVKLCDSRAGTTVVVERSTIAALRPGEPGTASGPTDATTEVDSTALQTTVLIRRPPRPYPSPRESTTTAIALFLGTLLIYAVSHQGDGLPFNYFVRLADAFLHGRLYLTENPSWLSELIPWEGNYYVVFPPMPAILLTPFVAVFGPDFPQPALSIVLGAANVGLAYLVLLRLFRNPSVALWTAVLYGIGTNQWYHAENGNAWYVAQITALFFLWLALLEATTRRRLLVIGLCMSGAFLSRVTVLGALAFFLVYFWDRFVQVAPLRQHLRIRVFIKPLIAIGLGLSAGFVVAALYNWARFGSVTEFGYKLIPGVLEEPWYSHGLISTEYIGVHLEEMFTRLPRFQPEAPFVIPRVYVMAFWVTTPAWVLILFARFRSRVAIASVAAILATLPPIIMHGGPGFTQFGHRFSLDYIPFLLLLTASGMRDRVTWWKQALILISIAINIWGVLMLSFYDTWVF